jgi:hypothetical protein
VFLHDAEGVGSRPSFPCTMLKFLDVMKYLRIVSLSHDRFLEEFSIERVTYNFLLLAAPYRIANNPLAALFEAWQSLPSPQAPLLCPQHRCIRLRCIHLWNSKSALGINISSRTSALKHSGSCRLRQQSQWRLPQTIPPSLPDWL